MFSSFQAYQDLYENNDTFSSDVELLAHFVHKFFNTEPFFNSKSLADFISYNSCLDHFLIMCLENFGLILFDRSFKILNHLFQMSESVDGHQML